MCQPRVFLNIALALLFASLAFTAWVAAESPADADRDATRSEVPRIVVSPASLSAGLLTGQTVTQFVTIGNAGFVDLTWAIAIDSLASSTSADVPWDDAIGYADSQLIGNQVVDRLDGPRWLRADPTSGRVPPGGSIDVAVTFDAARLAGGDYGARISIKSKDPSRPMVGVRANLHVTGAPDIVVGPDSLSADLLSGQMDTQALTIENTGFADLTWAISIGGAGGRAGDYLLTAPRADASPPPGKEPAQPPADGMRVEPLRARLNDLTGVDILWDCSRNQPPPNYWSVIRSDLVARGATVTDNYAPITPQLLAGFDVFWSEPPTYDDPWSEPEMAATADWVQSGGGLLLEGSWNPGAFSALLAALSAGIAYSGGGTAGYTTNIHLHKITEGIDEIYLGNASAHLTTIDPPAKSLVDDAGGQGACACARVGVGGVVAISTYLLSDNAIGFADNQLLGNQAADWLAGRHWLRADPASGTVPAGGSAEVAVTFDATGMYGGDCGATLVVSSNDPGEPEVAVAAHLHVTGVPDIEVSETAFDYGPVLVGATRVDTLTVANTGTILLTVAGLTVPDAAYIVDGSGFALVPGGSRDVEVVFTPNRGGPIEAELAITSDDPDEPEVVVALTGVGVLPPDIAVSPGSLSADLVTGQAVTEALTIENTGFTDLDWAISIGSAEGRAGSDYLLTAPLADAAPPPGKEPAEPRPSGMRTEPLRARLDDLTGVNILWDCSRGQSPSHFWSVFMSDLELRGATVTDNYEPITRELLAGFDVFWSEPLDPSHPWSQAEIAAISDWVHLGGGLLLEGSWDLGAFNALLATLSAGIAYGDGGTTGYTTHIYPHEITTGVGSIYLQNADAHLATTDPPAERLVDDAGGQGACACARVGIGKVVAISAEVLWDYAIGFANNQRFGNQAVDWLAAPHWVSVDPAWGTVPAGGSAEVAVTFDATATYGGDGDYDATLMISSNDPDEPEVSVAAHLHVTGVPDIEVSETAFDYGPVFIGATLAHTLTVANAGMDLLTVAGLTVSDAAYVVDGSGFALVPGQSRDVEVFFTPDRKGLIEAELTITSDDPDEPEVVVALTGVGVLPPDIAVSPDSLSADLLTGQTVTEALTIENTGFADLTWAISIESAEDPYWVSADPASGTVPAGESAEVAVTFDAAGMYGGDYDATLVVASNDPDEPEVGVAAHLRVTGVADIEVSETAFDYGPVFIGATRADTLTVANAGTDLLTIAGLAVSDSAYAVAGSGFALAPGESRDVEVFFTPDREGPIEADLTITSDDPDEPEVVVTLTGVGVLPPDIAVSPDSLSADLLVGQAVTEALTIENTGFTDLDWAISIGSAGGRAESDYLLTAPRADTSPPPGKEPAQPRPSGMRTEPLRARLDDLTGVDILWDCSRDQPSPNYYYSVIRSDLVARGATVTDNYETITPQLLSGFDLFLSAQPSYSWSEPEVAAICDWVHSGGGVLLDIFWTPQEANALLAALSAGISYDYYDGSYGYTTAVYPHEITMGVDELYLSYTRTNLSTIDPPAERLVDYADGQGACACQRIGAGRVVAISGEVLRDWTIGYADNQLFGNQAVDWVAPRWLRADPAWGTVPAGGSAEVAVTFDAARMYGGDYGATLVVSSNDPDEPEVSVAAHLHVTGVPDIEVAETELDCGPVFIGATRADTLTVANAGTDLLTIAGLAVSDAAYAVDGSGFALAPGESRDVEVFFTPDREGLIEAELTITSDDPDEPEVVVALTGVGVLPPDIAVSPDSLSADLLTGQTVTEALTIENTGFTDLTWAISFERAGGRAGSDYLLTAPRADALPPPGKGPAEPRPSGMRTEPLRARLDDLTGMDILWDCSHGQGSWHDYCNVIMSDLMARGATVTDNYETITPQLLSGFDLFWSAQPSYSWSEPEVAAICDWVHSGGGVLLEIPWSPEAANALMTALSAGIRYDYGGKLWYTTLFVYPHEITAGVDELYMDYTQTYLSTIDPPAQRLADKAGGQGTCACQQIGAGRVVAIAGFVLCDWAVGYADNQLFGNQAVDWLVEPNWLRADPASGTVPAGGSAEVAVTFDAARMYGGDYGATLMVSSNDPDEPEVSVAAHLHVTGVADIEVSETAFDFGPVFIGATQAHTLTIANAGTDLLTIAGLAVSDAAYGVDGSGFALQPNGSRDVEVLFAPDREGPIEAELTITSDDPDEPEVVVALTGVGVLPPDIAVSPDSLSADLLTGQTVTEALAIENTGFTDLTWAISIGSAGGLAESDYLLTAPRAEALPPPGKEPTEPRPGGMRTEPLRARLADLTGMNILWDCSHGQGSWQVYCSVIMSDLMARGATVTDNYEPITPQLLSGFDLLWSIPSDPWSEPEMAAIRDWVQSGGGVLLEIPWSPAAANALLATLSAGISYDYHGGSYGYTTAIYPHEITAGVDELYLDYTQTYLSTIDPPAQRLVDDAGGQGTCACQQIGAGKVVTIAWLMLWDWAIGYADNQLFGNQAVDWLVKPRWLRADPTSGTVLPGATTDVTVTFDATGLEAGDYQTVLHIGSNDPDEPVTLIPVQLHVGGRGRSSVSAMPLPTAFALRPNTPNPFRQGTTISFDLAEPSVVHLRIYDVSGREMGTLVDGAMKPGRYELRWDGRDDAQRAVGAGVYYCRIECGAFVATRRMVLVR
jgi:hypothetical protein